MLLRMKRLTSKPCNICGTPIKGVKRADRNAYYFSPRCTGCARKAFDPEVRATRRRCLDAGRVVHPLGSTRLHACSGFIYRLVKTSIGWEYEHRVITGAAPDQVVHHINENTLDNRIENLRVMSPAEHLREHHALVGVWSKLYDCCRECGTTERRHLSHGHCTACYQRLRYVARGHGITSDEGREG